ncbi:MAG: hypothetical protein R3246_00010 [Acidimicrobiia bacterium]|nr:hypothetical protein [Acidimicrobiia bacterium]
MSDSGWAQNADKLTGAGLNLSGRRLTGPQQGFGPMWQKTYRTRIPGVAPEHVIAEWKANFGQFWPSISRFNAPMAGIAPGEVGGIKSMQLLSTGVLVLYADDTSFTFMTPEGHPFAGWVTFSSYDDDGTVGQVELIIRPSDPLWDLAFMLGAGRGEDWMWQHTVTELARHFGVEAKCETKVVRVDRRRVWKNWRNVKNNAAIGSLGDLLTRPLRRSAPPA